MCGVFGLLSRTPVGDRLSAMECALRHRGRDGSARLVVDEGGIGLVRLALVGRGEVTRVAPARVGQRTVHAVVNGEIYEHYALRRTLEDRGIAVEGATDAAVAAALVAADGIEALFALRATFAAAFVIEEGGARSLVLARDVVGKKPLFYASRHGELAFASEVKGLVAAGVVDVTPSSRAVARFLSHGLLDEDEPLLEGVEVLPAGCVLEVDLRDGSSLRRRGSHIRRVASLDVVTVDDREALLDAMARAFTSAVSLRVPDEASAHVLFSGGADSSLVAHAAAQLPLSCVRVAEHDESDSALARARAIGRPLAIVEAGAWSRARLRRALALLEVPDAASSWSMAPALLALGDALQASGVRAALTGEGADEIFLGYPWHALAAAVESGAASSSFADGTPEGAMLDAARGLALADALADRPRRGALDLWLSVGGNQRRLDVIARDLAGVDVPMHRAAMEGGARGRQLDALTREMRALPVLHADRLLLSCGVEARMPFLDVALVRLALAAPARWLEGGAIDSAREHVAHDGAAGDDGGREGALGREMPEGDARGRRAHSAARNDRMASVLEAGKPLLRALGERVAPGLTLPPKRGFRGVPRPSDGDVEELARARIAEGTRALPLARLLVRSDDARGERTRIEALWRAFLVEETLDVVARGAAEGVP